MTRQVFAEIPPRVDYTLTELGRSLTEPVCAVADWAEANIDRITGAQGTAWWT